ncbi:MAG: DUF1846 domain-containing protein [Oscillospiraceae bacterium]|nr:DUF1846 domain-containing protein [Oscillospiraceae bacterium]
MYKQGFDNDKYVRMQSERIRQRISELGGKLYLEFGGKLFDDYHASRVLPGFRPDSKIRMLMEMKDEAEIIVAINADHIERNKRRGDLGITYDMEALRLIDAFRAAGLYVGGVCITHCREGSSAPPFQKRLESLGLRVYRQYVIPDYPSDVPLIVSENGFGKSDFIETTRPLVVITAPGPGSGKMSTCLCQLYHHHVRGEQAGYAKFETFPIWNLPLKHPVNLAYEAATADLDDVNMIDPFHLEAYGKQAVNYNRDVEIFPVLSAILDRIMGESPYKSPTDMGVNMAGYCISDDEVCREASRQEVIRRWYRSRCEVRKGLGEASTVHKLESLMSQMGISGDDRPTVAAALAKSRENGDTPAVAMELPDGRIVTGKTSSLLGACSACLLNALKTLAGIDDGVTLLSPEIITPLHHLKVEHLGSHNPRLHVNEALIALSVCAVNDPVAARAMEALNDLAGSEAHATVILAAADETALSRLGINLTCEPKYETHKLYHG